MPAEHAAESASETTAENSSKSPRDQQADGPAPSPDPASYWPQCLERLKTSLPEREFLTWLRPLQPHAIDRQLILYAPNSLAVDRLKGDLETQLRCALGELAPGLQGIEIRVGCRPAVRVPPPSAGSNPRASRVGPSVKPRLNEFLLAQLHQRLSKLRLGLDFHLRLREAAWSIEYGALAKVPDRLKAINAAVKLIREGQWTRPNRMPPNWRLSLDAGIETCVAA